MDIRGRLSVPPAVPQRRRAITRSLETESGRGITLRGRSARSSPEDEVGPVADVEPGGVYQNQPRRTHGNDVTIASGLDAAAAVGAGAARLAKAAVVRPATATAVGILRLGWHFVPGVTDHPLLAELATRGERMKDPLEQKAADALRALLRRAVDASLTAIDLTELVRAHVDLDALAAGIDVDAVIARADIDAAIARTDLDAIVETVDLDAIVERIDPDTVVARVDVEAVLARLDLAGIARQVIDAIDLPGILRQSTGAVSSQAARVIRTEGMNADESVSRFIDRVLRRPHQPGAVTP